MIHFQIEGKPILEIPSLYSFREQKKTEYSSTHFINLLETWYQNQTWTMQGKKTMGQADKQNLAID